MKVGYKIFGQNTLNYGTAYCLYKNKIIAESVSEKTANRLLSLVCTRGDENTDLAVKAVQLATKNDGVNKIARAEYALKSFGGIERYITPNARPWEIVRFER